MARYSRLETFRIGCGWRRRSRMYLDNAGCPRWLISLRCPMRNDWGGILADMEARGEIRKMLPEDDQGEMEMGG